jgi:hypothetical protein
MEDNKIASFPKRRKYETTFNYETETQHANFFNIEKDNLKYMSNNNSSSPSSGVNSDGSTLPSLSSTLLSPLSESMRLSPVELDNQMIQNELDEIKSCITEVASTVEENFDLISGKLNQHTSELVQKRIQMQASQPSIQIPTSPSSDCSLSSILERLNGLEILMNTMLTQDAQNRVQKPTKKAEKDPTI